MKTLDEIKQTLQDHKEDLRERCGISRIGIFGSWEKKQTEFPRRRRYSGTIRNADQLAHPGQHRTSVEETVENEG